MSTAAVETLNLDILPGISDADRPVRKTPKSREEKNEDVLSRILDQINSAEFTNDDMPEEVQWNERNLDLELVDWGLKRNVFEHQRPLGAPRVKELANKMIDGRWISNVIAIALYEGREILVNGQHTLYARRAAGTQVKKKVRVFVGVWNCKTPQELACLWNQWDTGGARTMNQLAAAFSTSLGENWTPSAVALIASSLAYADHGTSAKRLLDKESRLRLINESTDVAEFINQLIFTDVAKDRKHLQKMSILSAIIKSYRRHPDVAAEFWTKVHLGLDLTDQEDPAYLLREYLVRLSIRDNNVKNTITETDFDIEAKCIIAFNYYLKGKKAKMIKTPVATRDERGRLRKQLPDVL